MKTLRCALVCLLLLSIGACSGGGDNGGFDFSGAWNFSKGPGGVAQEGTITQNGTQMNLYINEWNHTGTCDPAGGTFDVAFQNEFEIYQIIGTSASGTTMSGETRVFKTAAPNVINYQFTWTATLLHR